MKICIISDHDNNDKMSDNEIEEIAKKNGFIFNNLEKLEDFYNHSIVPLNSETSYMRIIEKSATVIYTFKSYECFAIIVDNFSGNVEKLLLNTYGNSKTEVLQRLEEFIQHKGYRVYNIIPIENE